MSSYCCYSIGERVAVKLYQLALVKMKSIWTGSLSFGLVNIPVNLYGASEERTLSFKLIDKHGNCPISYVRVCRSTHKEVPYADIVKGYEYQKGDYVVLDEADFKKASPKKTELIDIVQFSDEADIDPIYFEKPYYIEPERKAVKAYALLRDALRKTKKVAIAKFVLREKEHVAAIVPENDILILHQLRYSDEIKKDDAITVPKGASYKEEELHVALSLVKQLDKKFDPKKFHDTYTQVLEDIIKAKAKGKTIKIAKEKEPVVTTDMKDLMKLLKQSLDKEKVH
jgi:DNA end-binding protein Ku